MTDVKEAHEKVNRVLAGNEDMKALAQSMTLFKLMKEYVSSRNLKPKTVEVYEINMTSVLKAFLKDQYEAEDIALPEINLPFLYRFEIFLLTYRNRSAKKPLKPGTAILYRQKLKALIEHATDMMYYTHNPFGAWRDRKVLKRDKATEITRVLSPQQLDAFEVDKTEKGHYLARVRLLFLLQSWTGFSFSDLISQNVKSTIRTDNGGKETIFYNRAKNDGMAILPLFPQAKKILEELDYNVSPEASYALFRDRIKQLFALYGLPKTDVGTHTGRHAFGERMLYMGFQMSDVSRMMGHNSISITEKVYAKVDHTKIWASYERIQSANSPSNPAPVE